MTVFNYNIKPKFIPELDKDFEPAVLMNKAFIEGVKRSGKGAPLKIAVERSDGLISVCETLVYDDNKNMDEDNFFYVERLVKTLLWAKGGWKIIIGGSQKIGDYIRKAYSTGGLRNFDREFMSKVYEKPFVVEITDINEVPAEKGKAKAIGRNLSGCRIGFDAGGSDRKVSAVIDGEAVFSEEVIWHPKTKSDPDYHYHGILTSMKTAAAHMPRVDAIGVSSAGIYIDNKVMVASLFLGVPYDLFEEKAKNIYLDIQDEMGGMPLEVANDGDVAALAGAMDLKDTNVLGIAMGTSEAGGFVDGQGNITGWLNELAFVPVDFNPDSMVDEWSGDYGCGVKYFSQDSVIKLAPAAGIELSKDLTPAEKLKVVKDLHAQGDKRAEKIFETIGCYLGYAIAYYAGFYDIKHILLLGRVTSGEGGSIMLKKARNVLEVEFPRLSDVIQIHLPDESNRRVGQSIAAASLPE